MRNPANRFRMFSFLTLAGDGARGDVGLLRAT